MSTITTQTPEIPIIIEKPKTNYLNLILISICFILFSVGVYYLGKQSVNAPEKPVTVLPQTTAIPTSIVDLTSNWKTYTDINLGISYSFPKDWYITPTDNINFRIQNYNPEGVAGRGYDPTVDRGKTFIAITPRPDLANNPLLSLKLSLLNSDLCYFMGDEAGNTVIVENYMKTINSIEYLYQKKYCSKINPNTAHTSVFITNNYKVIELGFGLDESVADKYFEQILSTFKFTESIVVSATPVKTQSYTNGTYGFSINYPQGWRIVEDKNSIYSFIGFGPSNQGEDVNWTITMNSHKSIDDIASQMVHNLMIVKKLEII